MLHVVCCVLNLKCESGRNLAPESGAARATGRLPPCCANDMFLPPLNHPFLVISLSTAKLRPNYQVKADGDQILLNISVLISPPAIIYVGLDTYLGPHTSPVVGVVRD